MKLLMTVAAAMLLGAGLTGCIFPGHPYHRGVAVTISPDHVHDAHCGHYYYRSAPYHWEGHSHGDGCGHIARGGIWVID
jgi:hypothetical protein